MYKVMIVDDDPTYLAIGKAFLSNDYEVSLKHSGHQALGSLQEGVKPDLILLDMFMPDINGMELLKIIQSTAELKEIPVIFLSSSRDSDIEVEGYKNGACDFLEKPVNRYLLNTKLQQWLGYAQMKRENIELKQKLGM